MTFGRAARIHELLKTRNEAEKEIAALLQEELSALGEGTLSMHLTGSAS